MRLFVRGAGIGLALLLLAGCHRAPLGGDWADLAAPSILAKGSLQYYWRSKVELEEDETVQQLWRLDENLYALTSAGRLFALDASSGTYKWDLDVAGADQKVFDPCHADGLLIRRGGDATAGALAGPTPFDAVILNTLSYALVIDRAKGKLERRIELPFAANTAGSTDGTSFFVGSVRGWCYAIILDTGLIRWQTSTEDLMTARPVFFGGRVYAASQDSKFYSIRPMAEEERHAWTAKTDGPLTAEFVVDRRGCFVPSQDYKLYALDGLVGGELWTFRAQGPLMQPVQVGERTVYQSAERDRLYAIDLASGRQRWQNPEARVVLATVEPRGLVGVENEDQPYVFVLTADRHLLMIPEALGEVEVKLPLTGLELFVPNTTKPVIYAASADGKFVCLSSKRLRHLSPEMLID